MKTLWAWARPKLFVDWRLIVTYCVIYFLWGWTMNVLGTELKIAQFNFWWQIISCYLLYMVPISLLLRRLPFHRQYAYGLVAMGLLEFGGYALETSYAYPNNILDQLFGIRNFSLGMALFFAFYFPLGNLLVSALYKALFGKTKRD